MTSELFRRDFFVARDSKHSIVFGVALMTEGEAILMEARLRNLEYIVSRRDDLVSEAWAEISRLQCDNVRLRRALGTIKDLRLSQFVHVEDMAWRCLQIAEKALEEK